MFTLRKSLERGITKNDWLKSYHTFSFAEYYDPKFMHFSALRVINEDFIEKQSGFPLHSHQDMEIITYVISGTLEHQDSLGNKYTINGGEIQMMRAGSGITHSEFNHTNQNVHLLQIWILPRAKGLEPGYQQKSFTHNQKYNQLCPIVSSDKQAKTLHIEQDLNLYASIFDKPIHYNIRPKHKIWIQVVSGTLKINDEITLSSGDGLTIVNKDIVHLIPSDKAEILLFDFAH